MIFYRCKRLQQVLDVMVKSRLGPGGGIRFSLSHFVARPTSLRPTSLSGFLTPINTGLFSSVRVREEIPGLVPAGPGGPLGHPTRSHRHTACLSVGKREVLSGDRRPRGGRQRGNYNGEVSDFNSWVKRRRRIYNSRRLVKIPRIIGC